MADQNPSEKLDKGAESPTTARPIDFDDDQQETGITAADAAQAGTPTKPPRSSSMQPPASLDEQPPAKPPRPVTPLRQAEHTLTEAFPNIDPKVVNAVLVASGGKVEPAFNALLGMSDPNYKDERPPAQPARANPQRTQLEEDELLARQLAAQYDRQHQQTRRAPPSEETRRRTQQAWDDDGEEASGTFEEDFAAIRENVRQGFLTTQSKVNEWITGFRKRMDGDMDEDEIGPGPASRRAQPFQRQNFGPSQTEQMQGIQKMAAQQRAATRRSTDQDRYDADNREIGDDFAELELRDEEAPPPKPARPTANPNLFKPTPPAPQSGPVDEVDALYRQPTPTKGQRQPSPSSGKTKKWQPLTSVAPAPEQDDNDPFSLGDSDDDAKEKSKDVRSEDTERLKKAASESQADEAGDQTKEALQEHERSGSTGTRDKIAEEILTGKK